MDTTVQPATQPSMKERESIEASLTDLREQLSLNGVVLSENGEIEIGKPDFDPSFAGSREQARAIIESAREANPENPKIQGVDFRRLDLSGLDLSGITFRDCDFTGTTFDDSTKLSGSEFLACTFDKATFRGANLSELDLSKSTFIDAKFLGVNFDNADLSYADFTGAKIEESSLQNMTTDRTNFSAFEGRDNNWSGTEIKGPNNMPFQEHIRAWWHGGAETSKIYLGLKALKSCLKLSEMVERLLEDYYEARQAN